MRKTKTGHQWANRWHPKKSKFPIEKVRALYQQGLSYRQIEAKTGWSNSYIAKACIDITRSQRDAAILRQPPQSKTWRACRAQARKIMERRLERKLASWEHVHHKDGDYTNNNLTNLELLLAVEHYDEHFPNRHLPRIDRVRLSEEKKKRVKLKCIICKKVILTKQSKINAGQKTCSHSCGLKLGWRKRKHAKS